MHINPVGYEEQKSKIDLSPGREGKLRSVAITETDYAWDRPLKTKNTRKVGAETQTMFSQTFVLRRTLITIRPEDPAAETEAEGLLTGVDLVSGLLRLPGGFVVRAIKGGLKEAIKGALASDKRVPGSLDIRVESPGWQTAYEVDYWKQGDVRTEQGVVRFPNEQHEFTSLKQLREIVEKQHLKFLGIDRVE